MQRYVLAKWIENDELRNMIWISKSSIKEYWLNDIYTHNALTIIKETLNPKLKIAIKEV